MRDMLSLVSVILPFSRLIVNEGFFSLKINAILTNMENKALIIAEIGTSHGGSLEKAKKLVDAAKKAGAGAVKFQIVYADEILHPKTGFVPLPTGNISLYERFKSLEVPPSFYKELRSYCNEKEILFGASPFGLQSAKELALLKPDFIKIASPELNHFPLLKEVSKIYKPILLSTGVSKLSDIETALECFPNKKDQIYILHCITSYPAPEEEYNLFLIKALNTIFGQSIGISDHSLDPVLVPTLSVLLGAAVIEKHICLSKDEEGLDDPIALDPKAFKLMVDSINAAYENPEQRLIDLETEYGEETIQKVLGNGEKTLALSEIENYKKSNRSLHYLTDMKKGEKIKKTDIAILRTEKELTLGESPEYFSLFENAVLQNDVSSGDGALFQDIIPKG